MAAASPEPRRRVADVIACALKSAGVQTLFGVPGGGSNLDVIAAAGAAGLPFVLTATETAGAIAALAQTEVAGTPGACLTTLGPGAASVVNGIACAYLDRAPVVVFTDSHPASASEFEHQQLDHSALLRPVTKSSESLTPDNAVQALTRALHKASCGRPGPVHLDCPGDVASAPAGEAGATLLGWAQHTVTPEVRAHLAALLKHARKPLLLVGLGARRAEDARSVREFCDRRKVPAMVTYKAKGVVPDGHPWFAGVFTNAAIEQPVMDECDLLIGVGLDPVELIPRPWNWPQPIVHCGAWRSDDGHVPFAVQVLTGVPDGLDEIDGSLSPAQWDNARVRALLDDQRKNISVRADGLSAQRVVEVAARTLAAAAARVTVDAGAHMFPATMLWPVTEPNRMLISNGLSTMGFALPAAVGAALVDRTGPVVALTGDGGLLMCVAELLTAVREKLRIITIVFSDASLSLIEIKQQARQLPASGVALGAIDWPALAGSFGVPAWSAANEEELDDVLGRALAQSGPSLIEAKIDRTNYGATLRAVRG
jgi:acetolactate synthase I/II/III large subunit